MYACGQESERLNADMRLLECLSLLVPLLLVSLLLVSLLRTSKGGSERLNADMRLLEFRPRIL